MKLKSFKFLRKLAELERLTDWAPDKSLGLVSAQVDKEYNLDNSDQSFFFGTGLSEIKYMIRRASIGFVITLK